MYLPILRNLALIFTLSYFYSYIFAQNSIYIAQNGNDQSVGDINAPLLSLHRAIELSRNSGCKKIIIRGGRYFDVHVQFIPSDSGLIIENYKNESPILYGGIIINQLQQESNCIYSHIPGLKNRTIDFRMILVNDSLRNISRLPVIGAYHYQNVWNVKGLPALAGEWERKPTTEELTKLIYNTNDIGSWLDPNNAEITVFHQWEESYLGIKAIDTMTHSIVFSYPADQPLGSYSHSEYIVWNSKEGMSSPGVWYIDRTNERLYYWLKEGEDLHTIEVIIPIYKNIFFFAKGSNNILINGLKLCCSTNDLQNESFAAANIDAAVSGYAINGITIENMVLENIGGNGIKLSGSNILIRNTSIVNSHGGGVYCIGDHIRIDTCKIANVGVFYKSAVGMQISGRQNRILNCNINNVPYSGIILKGDSSLIMNCTVTKTMMTFQDGAAIYGGPCTNSIIQNNRILGNNNEKFVMGIYFDELSQNCTANNNIVLNTRIPIHCNLSNTIHYNHNIFFDSKEQRINWGRSSNISIDSNLFISKSFFFSGPTIDDKNVDTSTVVPQLRKYANPNGLMSFKSNLMFVIENGNRIDSLNCLPKIRSEYLIGTNIYYVESDKILKGIRNIVHQKNILPYLYNMSNGESKQNEDFINNMIK